MVHFSIKIATRRGGMRNFFIVWSKQNLIIIPGFGIKESRDGDVIFNKV